MARHGVEHRVEPRFDHDLRQTGETKTHARDPDPKIPFTRESVNGGGGMVVVVVGWWWWWWRGRARSGACRAPDHVGSPPHLLAFLPTLPIDPPPSSSSSSSSPPLPDHRYSAPAPASAPPRHLSAPSLFQPKLEEQGRAGEGRELEWFSNKVFRRERKKWKIDSFFPFFLSFLRSNFWKINYIRKSSSDEVVSF